MIKLVAVKSLKGYMSLQNNNDLYKSAEDRANTAFDPNAELYRIHKCLKKSRDYWSTEVYTVPSPLDTYHKKFYAWLLEEYGLELQLHDSLGVSGIVGHKVVDEQKFLMFMLKFQ